MSCPYCMVTTTKKRTKKTKLGYATFFCPHCRCSFNERTGTPFNYLEFPTDIVLLTVLWRLRYKLSLRDIVEIFLARGLTFTHEAIRDWEARFAPLITEQLRTKRHGQAGKSWYVDETYLKVHGKWCYLYRAIDSDGNLVTDPVSSVAFSPYGKILTSGGYDRTVRLWEVRTGKMLTTLKSHTGWVRSVAFSPDGKTLASGSADQTVHLWEVNTGKVLASLQGHIGAVWSVAFSPDGKLLASGGEDQAVRLWKTTTGKVLTTLQGHTNAATSVAFNPDGKTLVSGGEDGTVRLWEVNTSKALIILQGHLGAARSVVFSPDGKMLTSGGDDRAVRLWEPTTGKVLATLQGHMSAVRSVTFSPDGKILASGSHDGTIKLWDTQTGECLHTLRSDRPYERMNITQVKGLRETQKAALRSLRAVEWSSTMHSTSSATHIVL